MDFIQRKSKPRPYAANSTGRPRGTLKLSSKIGRVQIYEAIGEAREIFVNELSQAIVSHLNDNSDKLQDSASFVDLSLFMMGKSPDRTKPIVMFVSDDKQVRTEAFRMIKHSGIMKDYPDFGLGEMALKAEFENLQPLGSQPESNKTQILVAQPTSFVVPGELLEVLATWTGLWGGLRLEAKTKNGPTNTNTSLATAGGVVRYNSCYMLHSVEHFLPASPTGQAITVRPHSLACEASEDECEVIGLSEDEEVEGGFVTVTSHGITTPILSDTESTSSSPLDTEPEAHGASLSPHDGFEPDQKAQVFALQARLDNLALPGLASPKAPPGGGPSSSIGQVTLISSLLDSAFVRINTSGSFASKHMLQLRDTAVPLESYPDYIEHTPNDAAIKMSTPHGTVGGTLSGTPSFVRLPGSNIFQKVYNVTVHTPLLPGDCGSWVKHAISGKLFGHVIAGSPTTGLVLVMPAAKVFAEALTSLSSQQVKTPMDSSARRNIRLDSHNGAFYKKDCTDPRDGREEDSLPRIEMSGGGYFIGTYEDPLQRRMFQGVTPRPPPPPLGFGDRRSARVPSSQPSGEQQYTTMARFLEEPDSFPVGRKERPLTIEEVRKERPLTIEEVHEALSEYFVIRFTKADEGIGKGRKPSWKRALRIEVPGLPKRDVARTIRRLNRTTITVALKMQSLSECEKRHVELALLDLQARYDSVDFQTTLAQLDDRVKITSREIDSKEKALQKRRHLKDSSLLTAAALSNTPSRSRATRGTKRVTEERISLTAYFKQQPRPDRDIFALFESRNEQHHDMIENAYVWDYVLPPRPSSPSTDQSVYSESFSLNDDATSCTSLSDDSSVSGRLFHQCSDTDPPSELFFFEGSMEQDVHSARLHSGSGPCSPEDRAGVLVQPHNPNEPKRRIPFAVAGYHSGPHQPTSHAANLFASRPMGPPLPPSPPPARKAMPEPQLEGSMVEERDTRPRMVSPSSGSGIAARANGGMPLVRRPENYANAYAAGRTAARAEVIAMGDQMLRHVDHSGPMRSTYYSWRSAALPSVVPAPQMQDETSRLDRARDVVWDEEGEEWGLTPNRSRRR